MAMHDLIRTLVLLAVLFAAHPWPDLHAQAAPQDTFPVYPLAGVTVTTTRSPADLSRVSQRFDLVEGGDLGLVGADAASALRTRVPLDVIEYPGLLSGISVRGFRPQFSGTNSRTLILVNGRPAGTDNVSLFLTGGLDRIEVLRGPASTLYGPGAMGGVVNLITRRSAGRIHGDVAASYGSFGSYGGTVGVGGGVTRNLDFDLTTTTSGRRSGYRIGSHHLFAADSLLKTLPDGNTTQLAWTTTDSVLDFAEFSSRTVQGRLGFRVGNGWRLDARAEGYRADDVQNPGDLNVTDYDGRSLKDVTRRSLDLSLTGSAGAHAGVLRVYSTSVGIDYFNSPVPPNFINFRTPTSTRGAQFQDVVPLGSVSVLLGADYSATDTESEAYDENGEAATPFNPNTSVQSSAAFAQARISAWDDRLGVTAGMRFDHITFRVLDTPHLTGFPANLERHDVLTPSTGLVAGFANGIQGYFNAGTAFVTPSAFNVAGYSETSAGPGRRGVFVARGNPRLKPETSVNWDAGVRMGGGDAPAQLDLAYFRTRVHDRIASELVPGNGSELTAQGDTILSTTTYINVDQADIRGVEARAAYHLGSFGEGRLDARLFLNGTRLLEARERFVRAETEQRIRNVAETTVIAGLDVDFGARSNARVTGRYVGNRVDTDYVAWWEPGEIEYPAYLVFDLRAGYLLSDRYRLTLDLHNALDEDYFEVRGYNLPGRSLRFALGAEF